MECLCGAKHYLARGNSVIESFGYTTIIVVAQLPGYYLAAWLAGKIKTKYVFAIYMLGTALGAFGNVSAAFDGYCRRILSFFNLGAWCHCRFDANLV